MKKIFLCFNIVKAKKQREQEQEEGMRTEELSLLIVIVFSCAVCIIGAFI
jgi:hypothetical protein